VVSLGDLFMVAGLVLMSAGILLMLPRGLYHGEWLFFLESMMVLAGLGLFIRTLFESDEGKQGGGRDDQARP